MTTILALDLGTQTGWAIYKNGQIVSGSKSFKIKIGNGVGIRYLRFRRWLDALRKEHGIINEVYFEEVRRHKGTKAAHCYGGFQGILTMWCEEWMIQYQSVPVGTIKLFAAGKGNASKEMMIDAALECGYDVVDDNQADAIHLLRYSIDAGT